MMGLLVIAALAVGWWSFRKALHADPARLAGLLRRVGGAVLLVLAGFMMLRGRLDMALLLGAFGLGCLAKDGSLANVMPRPLRSLLGRSGRLTRFRSAMIETELDHDSGRMRGVVLAGGFVGRRLDDLGPADLGRLLRQCREADRDGAQLLQAYLDRRFAGRRKDAEGDADPRSPSDPEGGSMTEQEAYQILGLEPGAPDGTVRQAYRQLMKKLHPDGGGSTYLASRVNQAKDVLLNRHR